MDRLRAISPLPWPEAFGATGPGARATKGGEPLSDQMDPYAPRGFAPVGDPLWRENARATDHRFELEETAATGGLRGTYRRLSPRTKRWCMAGAGLTVLAAACAIGAGVGVARKHHDAPKLPTGHPFADSFATLPANWTVSHDVANGGAYLCGFTQNAVGVADGSTTLQVVDAPAVGRPFGCGQLVHQETYLYGNYSARLQAARGLGVVTALFTYVETRPDKNQEVDIEFVGVDPTVLWASTWRDGHNFTQALPLGFDAAAAPHTYRFAWDAHAVRFFADDQLLLTVAQDKYLPRKAAAQLYVSTWLRAPNDWVGQYDPNQPSNRTATRLAWVAQAP